MTVETSTFPFPVTIVIFSHRKRTTCAWLRAAISSSMPVMTIERSGPSLSLTKDRRVLLRAAILSNSTLAVITGTGARLPQIEKDPSRALSLTTMDSIGSASFSKLKPEQPLDVIRHQPSRLVKGTLGRAENPPRAVAGMRDAVKGVDRSPSGV